jgi:hypothetical protein
MADVRQLNLLPGTRFASLPRTGSIRRLPACAISFSPQASKERKGAVTQRLAHAPFAKRHSITSWARNRNAAGIDLSFLLPIPSLGAC